MDEIMALAHAHRLFVLEDAAQAIGATWDGRPVGSLGHAAAFSFYAGKNLGALGEAGAVTTDDAELARQVERLRSHGEEAKHVHVANGFNERMDELQGAFLAVKLAQLDEAQELRDQAVEEYRRLLDPMHDVEMIHVAPRARSVHHLLVVEVADRDQVLDHLRASGIGAAVHYPTPIHLQPAFAHLGRRGQFPNAERLARSIISLPLFPGMTLEQVHRCVDALATAVRRAA
jgi:dTDP-4-amino-4,6-dideoxygalactose transaminase